MGPWECLQIIYSSWQLPTPTSCDEDAGTGPFILFFSDAVLKGDV